MADQLLIRVYDVGLGDCILCRIPGGALVDGGPSDFHMLIDCGSWSGMGLLTDALEDLAALLPEAGGKRRLDLLVITHEHKDHIAGCDPALFARFAIGAIWMNAAMDPDHPQASNARRLHGVATRAMRALDTHGLGPELQGLADLFGVDNSGAMTALRSELPRANGITPCYVSAGQTHADHGLQLAGATIHILAPEADIDGTYLGSRVAKALDAVGAVAGDVAQEDVPAPRRGGAALPPNIGAADFRRLRTRMVSNALGFASLSSKVTNNTSVVLLLEWQGKRLLFVGDAEWDAAYKAGKANGSWNVMWHRRQPLLARPLDFLKIGHHGSENATPWGSAAEPAAILDAILPLPPAESKPRAVAVVSTERGKYRTIPRGELLMELGRRVGNAQAYPARFRRAGVAISEMPNYADFEETWFRGPQPQRTDCERRLDGTGFVDVLIKP